MDTVSKQRNKQERFASRECGVMLVAASQILRQHCVQRFLSHIPVGLMQRMYRYNVATPLKKLACSVCDGIFRTEIGAPCLPLAELEGKVSAARLTDEVSINRGDSRNFVIRREQACPLAVAGNSH